jgi:type II secretion system protein N
MSRRAKTALGLAVTFVAIVALTFPTDALVRALLARVPLPDQMQLAFDHGALGVRGLRLDQVHLTRRDGSAAFDADWLSLWPSLLGLWRDQTGRPWRVGAKTCQGTIELELGAEGPTTPVTVTLANVEMGVCSAYIAPRVQVYGHASGVVHARLAERDPATGDATIELRGAGWRPGGPFGDDPIRADVATIHGQLADRRLTIDTFETSSDDFHVRGHGDVRFVTPVDDSVLDLRFAMTPGRTMPLFLRRLFDGIEGAPPDATGTRVFRVQGQLRAPRIIAAGTLE